MCSASSHPQNKSGLKLIPGIGPGIERRLNNADVYTFAQLAALSPKDLTRELHGVGISNARLQDWIERARQLAAEENEELTQQAEEHVDLFAAPVQEVNSIAFAIEDIVEDKLVAENLNPQNYKQYINFLVELWLREDNSVRRTRVTQLQDHSETAWSGWESQKLINFIVESATLSQPVDTSSIAKTQVDLASIPSHQGTRVDNPSQIQATALLYSGVQLTEMRVTTLESHTPTHILTSHQPFHVHLVLDLSKIDMPLGTPLYYSAEVFSKDLSRGVHQLVGAHQDRLMLAEQVSIDIVGKPLKPGPYRFEAAVRLTEYPGSVSKFQLMAFLDGGGFQVY
jgi:hypothetical protein